MLSINFSTELQICGCSKMPELIEAISADDPETVSLLLANGADPNEKEPNGNTALHEAIKLGDFGIVQLLINNGADTRVKYHRDDAAERSSCPREAGDREIFTGDSRMYEGTKD